MAECVFFVPSSEKYYLWELEVEKWVQKMGHGLVNVKLIVLVIVCTVLQCDAAAVLREIREII